MLLFQENKIREIRLMIVEKSRDYGREREKNHMTHREW